MQRKPGMQRMINEALSLQSSKKTTIITLLPSMLPVWLPNHSTARTTAEQPQLLAEFLPGDNGAGFVKWLLQSPSGAEVRKGVLRYFAKSRP